MPIVKIDLWEGSTVEEKDQLIRSVTDAVVKSIGVDPQHVFVLLNEVHKDNWGIGGKKASHKR